MIDPKAVATLDVYRDRERVGELARTAHGSVFRYSEAFLNSGAPPIALHLPKRTEGIEAGGTTNLPPFFAGLLPEGVMQEAITRSVRISRDDLFSLLAITGYDAVGDVTVRVPGSPPPEPLTHPRQVRELIDQILGGSRVGFAHSVSGVQPKLSIGQAIASSRGSVAIVKIEPGQYPGLLANEAHFMKLAPQTGIATSKVRLGEGILVVERFDRIKRPDQPPRQIHVEDALQIMDKYPYAKYSLDFLEIMDAARGLGVARSVLLDLLRLYAYSYVIGNGDLHAKNVSFQYRDQTWRLTPAYDLLCTLPYFPADTMALPLDEQTGEFTGSDFKRVGIRYELPEKALDSMLEKVRRGVLGGVDSSPLPSDVREGICRRAGRLSV